MRITHLAPLTTALALATSAAVAAPWDVSVSAYGWAIDTTTGVDTRYGRVETELSFSDALDALDFAVMGSVIAKKGPWTLVGDAIALDLTLGQPSPFGQIFSKATAGVRLAALSGYGLYRIGEAGGVALDAGAGLRGMSTEIDVTLHGVGRPDARTDIDDTWVDPVAALRLSTEIGRWRGSLWLDGGGFDIGNASKSTWQAMAIVTYAMNERWLVSGGYRHLEIDRETQGVPYDMTLSGPLLGISYRF